MSTLLLIVHQRQETDRVTKQVVCFRTSEKCDSQLAENAEGYRDQAHAHCGTISGGCQVGQSSCHKTWQLTSALTSPCTLSTSAMAEKLNEKEITEPVSLTLPDGKFNRPAHGWARQPIIDTSAINGETFNGLNRRWEYWCVLTPDHILAFSIANIDFAAPASVFVFDRKTNTCVASHAISGSQEAMVLPKNVEDGPASCKHEELEVTIDQVEGGTRLRAKIPGASFDVFAERPEGHERLAVVVPWDDVLFQYTVKDLSRPATGTVTIGDETFGLPKGESWAILDHGRGRWPHEVHWNWGASCGRLTDGRVFGMQIGDKWTDGTGSVENSFLLEKKLYKISEKLKWEYDTEDYMKPWKVSGGGLDATLTPFYDKITRIRTDRVTSNTDQAFGLFSGSFNTGSEVVHFKDIIGFAEDVTKVW